MSLKYIGAGFLVKLITGFDDTLTHVPVLASISKTRRGKIAFALGILSAICVAIGVSVIFARTISISPYYRYISAGLIFAIAFAIHFDIAVHKPRQRIEEKLVRCTGLERCIKMFFFGLIAALATVVDDTIAYTALFLGTPVSTLYAVIGILTASVFQLFLVVYFSEKIAGIKYKEIIASIGLVVLGVLIMTGVL